MKFGVKVLEQMQNNHEVVEREQFKLNPFRVLGIIFHPSSPDFIWGYSYLIPSGFLIKTLFP